MAMQVTLKLFAALSDYLPPGARANRLEIDIAESDSVAAIISRFGLPEQLVHLVLVNGVFIPPEDRSGRHLETGDVLAIWPPVAGG